MNAGAYLNFNGKVFTSDKLLISPNNRSFRYGDGCFETLKMVKGKIVLEAYHFERLFKSVQAMQFNKASYFISDLFKEEIIELAKKNIHKKSARIRITISRGNGGLYDTENHNPNYLIQTWDLNSSTDKLNENGLVMEVYTKAKKICDDFSHIKSNNFLCYAMGALWAKENKFNEAVILNPYNNVADTTTSNLFMVKDGVIKTPAITEGCIGGVTRKYLLKCIKDEGMPFEETSISIDDLLQASEVFLTNTVYGIRWVKEIGKSNYTNQLSTVLHKRFMAPLYV